MFDNGHKPARLDPVVGVLVMISLVLFCIACGLNSCG